jgi:hypothetical protein
MPVREAPDRVPQPRRPRELTPAERRISLWVRRNRGILSTVAREMGLSVQFVQRVAYDREAKSKGMRVERRLRELGCPLIQRVA